MRAQRSQLALITRTIGARRGRAARGRPTPLIAALPLIP